jgi:hypothetical protein
MQQQKIPKNLWLARAEFRQQGKWPATETFYLDKPYFPDVAKPMKCHVLYETPMEAFLSLHKEINNWKKKNFGLTMRIFIYSVRLDLITKGNYYSPEKVEAKQIFTGDAILLRRHLVRQSLNFLRAANIELSFNKFSNLPLTDVFFQNELGKEQYLTTFRKPKVSLTYGIWSKFTCQAIEDALFNFSSHDFRTPVTLREHDPNLKEKKDDTKCDLAST